MGTVQWLSQPLIDQLEGLGGSQAGRKMAGTKKTEVKKGGEGSAPKKSQTKGSRR